MEARDETKGQPKRDVGRSEGPQTNAPGNVPAKVLLATAGSSDAALAARAAVDLAGRGGSRLHVVHVWHDVPSPRFRSYIKAELERQGCEVLDEQVKSIEDAGGSVSGAHLRKGRPAEEIVGLAKEIGAGLIVVGSRGLGSVGRLVIGSVSEGVLHHARVPVLVMRGGAQAWPPSRVIVADDSFEDAQGEELAARVAGLFGAEVILIQVYQGLLADSQGGRDLTSRMVEDALRREEEVLNERADKMEEPLGERSRTRAFGGDPATSLLRVGEEDEKPVLLAVGDLELSEHVRIGSIADKAMRATWGPLLVSPRRGNTSKVREDGLLDRGCRKGA